MALARTYAMALAGVQGHLVEIEADIENGLVALYLVGLPDTALREARDRIRAAIVNSRESWPQRRVTVGLSPASLPKRGSAFDLAIVNSRHDCIPARPDGGAHASPPGSASGWRVQLSALGSGRLPVPVHLSAG